MSETRYVVPEGGLKDALAHIDSTRAHFDIEAEIIKEALEDFVRWLAKNPIVPTDKEVESMWANAPEESSAVAYYCAEWQRRMFLASKESGDIHLSEVGTVTA